MNILFTGGMGFIGQSRINRLPSDYDLTIVDSLEPQIHGVNAKFSKEMQDRAHCIHADIRELDRYADALEGVECVVHLASQTGTGQSMYDISRYVQQNIDGTARLLEGISRANNKPKRIILASSRAVYGEGAYQLSNAITYPGNRKAASLMNGSWDITDGFGTILSPLRMSEDHAIRPTSVYGMTKAWQEQLVAMMAKTYSMEHLTLRLQNVYGPGQKIDNPYTGIIGLFSSKIMTNEEVTLFEDGQMTRDFVHINDIASIFIWAIKHPRFSVDTLNVGTGVGTSLKTLTDLIGAKLGKAPLIRISGLYRLGDIRHAVADLSLLREIVSNWNPISLEDGLTDYLAWFVQQPNISSSFDHEAMMHLMKNAALLECNQ